MAPTLNTSTLPLLSSPLVSKPFFVPMTHNLRINKPIPDTSIIDIEPLSLSNPVSPSSSFSPTTSLNTLVSSSKLSFSSPNELNEKPSSSLLRRFTRFTISLLKLKLPSCLPLLPSRSLLFICFSWYFFSILNTNLKKQVLVNYKYPLTLLWCQSCVTCLVILVTGCTSNLVTKTWGSSFYKIHPSWYLSLFPWSNSSVFLSSYSKKAILSWPWKLLSAMVLAHLMASACHALALAHTSIAFLHTLKALAPCITWVLYTWIGFGSWALSSFSSFSLSTSTTTTTTATSSMPWSFLLITFGVLLTCHFQPSFSFLGFIFALLGTVFHCTHHILCKPLLHPPSSSFLSMSHLVCINAFASTLCLAPCWIYLEFPPFPSFQTSLLILAAAGAHVGQVILSYSILKKVDVLTFPLVALIKRCFTIVVSLVWFQTSWSWLQVIGTFLAFMGLYFYSKERQQKKSNADNCMNSSSSSSSNNNNGLSSPVGLK